MPAAIATPTCSLMPTSTIRPGNFLPKSRMPVPSGIAAVMPMIRLSFAARSHIVSMNAVV